MPRRDLLLVNLALVCGLLACVTSYPGLRNAPRQGWWEERGPVVPHDSFPAECDTCHAGDDWQTIRSDFVFDHERETGVALVGAHEQAECLRCHNDRGPVQVFAQRGCQGCHEDVHRGQMGKDCSQCHDEYDWKPNEEVALHSRTRLPLVGAHSAVQCWVCHPGAGVGSFQNVSPECISCHLADFQGTTNPDHVAGAFPTTCEDCHGFSSFRGATAFNHAGITNGCVECHLPNYQSTRDPDHVAQNFPTTCEDCHHSFTTWRGADFTHTGITTGCLDCHLSDYQGARDPNHVAQNFPTNCESCHHSFNTWEGADFSHSGITNGCVNCHLSDYQGSSDPRHSAAGFSQQCETCHTSTSTWQGARYSGHHFPIYSGAHSGFACSQCHLTNTNYDQFSCTHCHAHNQSSMASKHSGVNNYQWLSSRCYACHPNGRG